MENGGWKVWVALVGFAAVASAVVLYLRPELREKLFPPQEETVATAEGSVENEPAPKKKKKRGKRKPRKHADGTAARSSDGSEDFVDDYVPSDRFVIGNVFDEREEAFEEEEIEAPEPEFVPPKEMWQPTGPYKPAAKWGKLGENVVELSMRGNAPEPLSGEDITGVLNARKLMPCYDDVARKVPQMAGDVAFRVQVEGNGKPSYVGITSSQLRSRTVESCMVNRIRELRFPASQGGQRTRFDIDFTFE